MTYFTNIDTDATHGPFTLSVTVTHDDDATPPWEREDGHGPVSEWRKCNMRGYWNKEPGELLLHSDHTIARFYDFAEACKIARRDGWGVPTYRLDIEQGANGLRRANAQWWDAETRDIISIQSDWHDDINAAISDAYSKHRALYASARAYAADAARADFDRLRKWCNGEWSYVGVIVTAKHTDTGIELGQASLWGVESDDTDGLLMFANELADEALAEAREKIATLAQRERDLSGHVWCGETEHTDAEETELSELRNILGLE